MSSQQDVIKTFMKSLDDTKLSGTAALDEAVRACSNFSGIQDAIDHMVEDCKNSSSGTYFLKKYCGIDLYNSDTGAITGSDAGGSVIKTAESIVPESGESSYPSSTSFTKRGLTVIVPDKSTLTESEQIIVKGLYSWWIEEALKLIEESYGSNYSFVNNPHTINLEFVTNKRYSAAANSGTLYINMDGWKNIIEDDVNGKKFLDFDGEKFISANYLDRTIAHELTHIIMANNISSFVTLPAFIKEGMAELTHGKEIALFKLQSLSGNFSEDINDFSIKNFANDYSKLNKHLDFSITAPDESGIYSTTNPYSSGYIFLRYLAKQGSDVVDSPEKQAKYSTIDLPSLEEKRIISYDESNIILEGNEDHNGVVNRGNNVTINGNGGDDSFRNSGAQVIMNGGDGEDRITNGGSYVTINGGDGDDSITNKDSSSYVVISGEDGDDSITSEDSSSYITINGGNGDDFIKNNSYNSTIIGGIGNDTIINNKDEATINSGDGNDSIINGGSNAYINSGEGNDRIHITNFYSGAQDAGANVTIEGGMGDDTIENSATYAKIDGGIGNDSIVNYSGGGIYATINGGAGDDFIRNNSDYVTINAGTGDDVVNLRPIETLYVNNGSGLYVPSETIMTNHMNVITYANGDGNDTIYNLDSSDTIQIAGSSYSTMISGDDVIINVGDGSMTLKDAAYKTINIISSNPIEPIDNDEDSDDTIVSPIDINSKKGIKFNDAETKVIIDKTFEDSAVDLSGYSKLRTIDASKVNKDFEITANDRNNTIKGGKQADIINGGDGNDVIKGNAGNDELNGEDGNDKLLGGNGNDTLNGGDGNDTLTGGKSKDVFVFESDSGDDIITDYESGKDAIMLDDDIEAVTVKGKNVILIVGDNTLTIKKAKGKQIAFVDDDGEYTYQTFNKSVTFEDDDDDYERNFIESPDAGSGYWFSADDNFINDDLNSIVKVDSINCSVNKLDTVNSYDFTDLANNKQKSTAVTYAELNK